MYLRFYSKFDSAELRGLEVYLGHTDTHTHTHARTDISSIMYKIRHNNGSLQEIPTLIGTYAIHDPKLIN